MKDLPDETGWDLGSVERVSTVEQVVRTLRDAIVEGRTPQGAQLREVQLARSLGIGRGTVREAIRHLVEEGLVEYEVHRGAFVRVLTPEEGPDVYLAREVVEVGAVKKVLEAEGSPDLRGLEAALEEMKRIAAATDERPSDALIAADVHFHQELVRLAGSRRLFRVHETLAAETIMLLRQQPPYPGRAYVRDHAVLLEGLRQRDPAMPDLVARHFRVTLDLIRGTGELDERAGVPATSSQKDWRP